MGKIVGRDTFWVGNELFCFRRVKFEIPIRHPSGNVESAVWDV